MNFPDHLFPASWSWAALVPLLAVLGWAVATAPWKRLLDSTQLHGWLGAIVIFMVMWRLNANVRPGLNLHFLGATTLTLMFGRQLAIVALAVILAGVTAFGAAGWGAYPLNAVVWVVLPPFLAFAIYRLVERLLPANMFVYIFATGFFGAAATIILTGLVATLLLAVAGVYSAQVLFNEYYPYYALVGFAEAWLNGAAITLLAVYCPHWLWTFDDKRYLRKT